MKKQQALQRWHNIPVNQDILPHFTALPADAHGSTYGANRIRITGTPAFVDAVLSRIKDLLVMEAGATRLDFSINHIKPVFDKKWKNASEDAEVCYIGVRERTAVTRARRNGESTADLSGMSDTSSTASDSEVEDSDATPAEATPKMVEDTSIPDLPEMRENERDNGVFIVADEEEE